MRNGIALTIAGILLASSTWAQPWNIQFVDNEENAGASCRVMNDLSGMPHVFYVTNQRFLRHAWWTGSGWRLEQVAQFPESLGISASGLAVALDRSGKWHVAISMYSWGEYLHYLTDTAGGWRDTLLVSAYYPFMVDLHCSIALDTYALVHIVSASRTLSTDSLVHRWETSPGLWQQEWIDGSSDIRGPSIVIDAQNHIYAAYYRYYDLMLAYHDGIAWGTNVVDVSGNVGEYCSLKLDRNNRVCISYYDITNGDLKYAVGTPSFK